MMKFVLLLRIWIAEGLAVLTPLRLSVLVVIILCIAGLTCLKELVRMVLKCW